MADAGKTQRRRSWGKRMLKVVVVLAALWIVLSSALLLAMLQPPDRFGRIMARIPGPGLMVAFMLLPFEPLWNFARGGTLEVGDLAPDFLLEPVTEHGAALGGDAVRLSSFRGKQPVVLVFGSFT